MKATRRERHPMPEDISMALQDAGVSAAYEARPEYQRNDYIGWITAAKTQPARQKRLSQMLDELRAGGVYMRMAHAPSAKS